MRDDLNCLIEFLVRYYDDSKRSLHDLDKTIEKPSCGYNKQYFPYRVYVHWRSIDEYCQKDIRFIGIAFDYDTDSAELVLTDKENPEYEWTLDKVPDTALINLDTYLREIFEFE